MKTSMRMEWMYVTPDQARLWLEKNAANRDPKRSLVERLSHDIEAGNFLPSHQGLGIYEDGTLCDGQHRLSAIVATGKGVWTWVCFGIPLPSKLVVDSGIVRSDFDAYKIADMNLSRKMVEIAKQAQFVGDGTYRKMSRTDLASFIKFHDAAIRYAADSLSNKTKSLTIGVVGVVLFRAYYTADRDRLGEFVKVLLSGEYEKGTDEACIIFRNWLLTDPRATAAKFKAELYAKAENALNNFLRKMPMKKLYAASVELFPIPAMPWPDAAVAPATGPKLSRRAG